MCAVKNILALSSGLDSLLLSSFLLIPLLRSRHGHSCHQQRHRWRTPTSNPRRRRRTSFVRSSEDRPTIGSSKRSTCIVSSVVIDPSRDRTSPAFTVSVRAIDRSLNERLTNGETHLRVLSTSSAREATHRTARCQPLATTRSRNGRPLERT